MCSRTRKRRRRRKNRRFYVLKRMLTIITIAMSLVAIIISINALSEKHLIDEPNTPSNTQDQNTNSNNTQSQNRSKVSPSRHFSKSIVEEVTIQDGQDEELPQIYEGEFELPLQGATAYSLVNTNLYDESGAVAKVINAGDSLQIVREEDSNLIVKTEDGVIASISSDKCMLNLPDVIPSIIYMDTNSVSSVMRSSGYSIPNITGEALYNVEQYNNRLGRTEFNMPIMFQTAKKVMAVQKSALADGYSLCIVETYRPLETQKKISSNLGSLAASNSEVYNGIENKNWSKSWFIAQSISNHQRGYAMDVTLVKVNETEICTSGNYAYVNVSEYSEVQMPTQIHELSSQSIALEYGVKSSSATAWLEVPLAGSMNDVAIQLQNYCTSAGFTPLASEWWHFNDLDAKNSSSGSLSDGNYFLQTNLSVIP